VFYKDSIRTSTTPARSTASRGWCTDSAPATRPRRCTAIWPRSVKYIRTICVRAARQDRRAIGEGDALLEDAPGHLVGVKTADCLPILLVDRRAPRRGGRACRMARHVLAALCAQQCGRMGEEFGTRAEAHARRHRAGHRQVLLRSGRRSGRAIRRKRGERASTWWKRIAANCSKRAFPHGRSTPRVVHHVRCRVSSTPIAAIRSKPGGCGPVVGVR
jgi:hypothetical protein